MFLDLHAVTNHARLQHQLLVAVSHHQGALFELLLQCELWGGGGGGLATGVLPRWGEWS